MGLLQSFYMTLERTVSLMFFDTVKGDFSLDSDSILFSAPDAGKMTKKLKWAPTPDGKGSKEVHKSIKDSVTYLYDGSLPGVFLTLSVTDKVDASGSVTYSLPVTLAEVEVIKNIMSFCLPRFLGLHKMF